MFKITHARQTCLCFYFNPSAGSEIPARERRATEICKGKQVLLLGRHQKEKTSLKKCLRGELFNPNEGSTEGVEGDLISKAIEKPKERVLKAIPYSQEPNTIEMDPSPKRPQDKLRVSKHPENIATLSQRLYENVNEDEDDIQR